MNQLPLPGEQESRPGWRARVEAAVVEPSPPAVSAERAGEQAVGVGPCRAESRSFQAVLFYCYSFGVKVCAVP